MTLEVPDTPFAPDALAAHEAATERFAEFGAAVDNLKNEIDELRPWVGQHPAFLGIGAFHEVYAFSVDENVYALRLPRTLTGEEAHVPSEKLADKSVALARASGITCAEQLVTYAPGALITNLMAGTRLDRLQPGDTESVTDEQLVDLIDSIQELYDRDLTADVFPTNLFLDKDQGFGIVDIQTRDNHDNLPPELQIDGIVRFLNKNFSISDPANAGNRLERLYSSSQRGQEDVPTF